MKKQDYIKKYYLINEILIDWNPLGVDGSVLNDEYISIIPSLIRIEKDGAKLKEYLIDLLDKRYGVNYDKEKLMSVIDKIIQLQ